MADAPSVSRISWVALVDSVEKDRYRPQKAYKFSNDRAFADPKSNKPGYVFPWGFDDSRFA